MGLILRRNGCPSGAVLLVWLWVAVLNAGFIGDGVLFGVGIAVVGTFQARVPGNASSGQLGTGCVVELP